MFHAVHGLTSSRYSYDFDMRTGQSETGLKACTYEVRIVADADTRDEIVCVATPQGGSGWQLVELRPVSEGMRI